MELSTKGRYAVMAMVDLAQVGATADAQSRSITLYEIANRQEISQSYLEQLFAQLRKAGLVAATRGPGGGYRLARAVEDIPIAAIMEAVNEPLKATRCGGDARKGCLLANRRCLTHDLWHELSSHIAVFLGSVTLADVVGRKLVGRAEALANLARVHQLSPAH